MTASGTEGGIVKVLREGDFWEYDGWDDRGHNAVTVYNPPLRNRTGLPNKQRRRPCLQTLRLVTRQLSSAKLKKLFQVKADCGLGKP